MITLTERQRTFVESNDPYAEMAGGGPITDVGKAEQEAAYIFLTMCEEILGTRYEVQL